MEKYQNRYRIPSTRLQNWDYGWNAAYFITICTKNRTCFFGHINDQKMHLSNIGVLADVFWHEIKRHANNVDLGAFVVMPNHVHGILIINDNGDNDYRDNENAQLADDMATDDIGMTDDVGVTHDVGATHAVETRHALSLQQNHQQTEQQKINPNPNTQPSSFQTIGQKRFQNQGKNTLSSIIGSYKSAVSKHAHRLGFEFEWQARFHDHIIRDPQSFENISKYIIENPSKWKEDKFFI